jgi:hypothetical protein
MNWHLPVQVSYLFTGKTITMKKLPVLFLYAIMCIFIPCSCVHNDKGHSSFSVSESDYDYSMTADFSKSKTRTVEEFMDYRIGRKSNMSFVNTRIDGRLALDDHTTFYIRKYPGFVKIKVDKEQNTTEGYQQIKAMCEGIKKLLVK